MSEENLPKIADTVLVDANYTNRVDYAIMGRRGVMPLFPRNGLK